VDAVELGGQFGFWGEVVVAFEHDAGDSREGGEVLEEVEGALGDGVGVGVVVGIVALDAAAHVDVGDAVEGEAGKEGVGVGVEVAVVGVAVGDVEEEVDVGAVDDFVEEVGFVVVVVRPGEEGGDVFEGKGDGEEVLGAVDVVDQDVQGDAGAGDGEEVTGFAAGGADEGDVFGDEGGVECGGEVGEVADAIGVDGFGAAEGEADAVGDDVEVAGAELVEMGRKAAGVGVVFGGDLDEGEVGMAVDEEGELGAPADAEAEVGEGWDDGGHSSFRGLRVSDALGKPSG
jgi:hypothetical protein